MSTGTDPVTRFLYDGDALVAEYDYQNNLQHRYVHGNGIDNPLLWYDGSTVSEATRRHLYANWQGSIAAITDGKGELIHVNAYDAYGIPNPTNIGRFQYTGQIYLPELGIYHYKARAYSATLGRFLQTDPIGYEDQYNLYAYVGGDPVNAIDPSGKYRCSKADCPKIKSYAKQLKKVADGDAPTGTRIKSSTQRFAKAALKAIGSENDGGKVTIKDSNLAGSKLGKFTAGKNKTATIELDFADIEKSGVAGGAVLGHEVTHYGQSIKYGAGLKSLKDGYNRELAAYSIQFEIMESLNNSVAGHWQKGMSNAKRWKRLRSAAHDACIGIQVRTSNYYGEAFPGETCP